MGEMGGDEMRWDELLYQITISCWTHDLKHATLDLLFHLELMLSVSSISAADHCWKGVTRSEESSKGPSKG